MKKVENISLPDDTISDIIHHSKLLCAASAKFNVDLQRLSKNNSFSIKDFSELLLSLNRFFVSNCELLETLSDYQYKLLEEY